MGNASVKRNGRLADAAVIGRQVRPVAGVDPRAERAGPVDSGLADDVVNRASNDSFPASDAPAWINRGEPAA